MKTRTPKQTRRSVLRPLFIIHYSLFAASLLLASCVMEEVISNGTGFNGAEPVKFQAGIGVETRVSNPAGDHWDAQDTIGLYMIRSGSTLADSVIRENTRNKPYIVSRGADTNTATFVTAGDTAYYPNGEDVNFLAYYPYSTAKVSADHKYLMDVSDQREPGRLDLLYSNDKAAYNSRNHDAHLPFAHLMTRVVFEAILTGSSQASLAGLQLEMQNVNTSTAFDLATGTPASDGAGQSKISPLTRHASADSVRMEATLIPTADAGNIHLLFTLNNKTYQASLPTTKTGTSLQKGKRYTYKVVFDEAEITLTGHLSPWDEEPGDTINPNPAPTKMALQMEGYRGQVKVTYASGGQETLSLDGAGRAAFGAAFSGDLIKSLTLGSSSTPILIGRKVADANPLSLKVDVNNNPLLRNELNGYIPIGSYAEFQLINNSANLGKKYKQESALDLLSVNWTPIGSASAHFTGEYNGGEYELTNLKVNVSTDYVGLFGAVTDAKLLNIRLVSGTVNGGSSVGGICGATHGSSSITNAYSGATVTGTGNHISGICGITAGTTTIISCRNTGNVKGAGSNSSYIGGIVGQIFGSTYKIKDCDNRGEIEGYTYTGGIAGCANSTAVEIIACRNSGTVKNIGRDQSGGIVGANENRKAVTVTACYNTGALNNNNKSYTGGIIGQIYIGSSLTACYNTGTVTGYANSTGLICGYNEATITSNYWTQGSSNVTKGSANSSGTDDSKAFSATAWPTTSEAGWGIGNGQAANTYWKSLGRWNNGSPEYPKLWWE
ncbi:MAG: fimbrillin family protein [Tannerellaceae bacterium]|jgi:hypothetical protein|nr:fimbrillin family protein [Tannerellaceae bacterium]